MVKVTDLETDPSVTVIVAAIGAATARVSILILVLLSPALTEAVAGTDAGPVHLTVRVTPLGPAGPLRFTTRGSYWPPGREE